MGGTSAREAEENNTEEVPPHAWSDQRVLSPAEAHAARLARYEQALDAACGITREGEPAHPAPQPQTKPRFNPVPFESVLRQVMVLPGMIHHLEGIDLDGDGVADIPPKLSWGRPPWPPERACSGRPCWRTDSARPMPSNSAACSERS